ncbi:MAG: porin [Tepidimonas taiwanensis]|nr:porin [Tepidimonas taiwanensis]
MKKSLIALAVAGTFAAPAAFAATANVDVYGVLNVSYDYISSDQPAPADTSLGRISSNSSRLGFKGSEDLGGGLSALWQIEMTIAVDGGNANTPAGIANAGASAHALRNTFVGLSSKGMGTILAGTHDTPYKLATARLDPFVDTTGDYNIAIGSVNGINAFELRANNALAYVSPNLSGFTFTGAYVFGGELSNGATADFDAWSVSGTYESGPLFGSLAYEKHNNIGVGPNGADDRSSWKVGLGYKFGSTALGLVYEKSSQTGNTVTDRDAWAVNVAHDMGPIRLMAAYYSMGDGKTAANTSANAWAIGANYNLSKRSLVYARYLHISNDTGASYGYVGGQGPNAFGFIPAVGTDPSVLSVGIRHSF